jgi:flagellar hook protein FlgE
MVGALWTGISGLAGQQTALDNESNNIANVNTVGFKASRISFADQMYQNKIGKGTTILDAEKIYSQGNLKLTGVAFDMALSGDGFFAVSNTRGAGTSETYYTRAGNFRMGDDGTLQDAAGNAVQGWAMTKLSDSDVVSTDQNISKFTDDFTKLAASQIIRNVNTIETVTAKMTDYTESAVADALDVFTGSNYKTKAAKISNIEALISEYSEKLINYKNDPEATSITPGVYKNTLDFSNGISNLNGDGDTISVYIDGAKYSQTWDTDLTTTLKNFTDQLSNITGINAWITDTVDSTTKNPTDTNGFIRIESMIPGDNVTISQLAITTSAGAQTPGNLKDNSIKVESGGGWAAVTAARDALKEAVTGKQQDVYTSSDLSTPNGNNDYTYQITIYDPQGNQNISVPSSPLSISNPTNIQDIVETINGNTLVSKTHTTTASASAKDKYTFAAFPSDPLPTDYYLTVGSRTLTIPSGTAISDIEALIENDAYFGDTDTIKVTVDGSDQLVLEHNTANTSFQPTLAAKNSSDPVAGELPYYVKASNVNGNLTIKTLDSNYDLEFSGDMKATAISEVQTVSVTGTATLGAVSFLGHDLTASSSADDTSEETIDMIIANKAAVIATWNGANGTKEIADIRKISTTTLEIIYKDTEGDVAVIATDTSDGITFAESEEVTAGSTSSTDMVRNTTYSGREGANGEFLELKSTVEQAGSRGSLQLRLDTLGISNSPFGDFAVDSTGMITMKQDGAEFAVGQVAIALFNDNRGLLPIGDNLLQATEQSGSAIYNLNNNKTADVKANTLELSTADLSVSLVNMMVFQRAFEANAKSITTADTILNTLINLKR